MKLNIYGSGCRKCKQLTANAEEAVHALGVSYEINKVTDMNSIIEAGILHTPALSADDKVVCEGKVASVEELKKLLV